MVKKRAGGIEMKECPVCKAKNRNDAGFCSECGADLKDVAAQTDEWAAAAGSFLNKAKEVAASGAKKAKEAAAVGAQKAKEAATVGAQKMKEAAATGAEKVQKAMDDADQKREAAKAASVSTGGWDTAVDASAYTPAGGGGRPMKGSSALVDQGEQIVATIGSNYLQSYLSGGGVGKGIGVLTQKRFYYKGKNFSGKGKGMTSTTEEGVVSLEDITFTRFTFTRPIGLLVFAILLAVGGLVTVIADSDLLMVAAILWAASLLFFVIYFVNRHTLFLISFPGGGFAFDVHYYPIADIRDFQRQLHLLKDHIKEGAAV